MLSSTVPALASTYGFIFCTLIALWETSAPAGHAGQADALLHRHYRARCHLRFSRRVCLRQARSGRGASAATHHALPGAGRRCSRFTPREQTPHRSLEAVTRVSRLAATGQTGMQRLYNTIVERNLDTGALPIGTRVRITMLAQLMDISAAFGCSILSSPIPIFASAALTSPSSAQSRRHYRQNHSWKLTTERPVGPDPSLLDRVDGILHSILSMPLQPRDSRQAARSAAFQQSSAVLFPEHSASHRPSPSRSNSASAPPSVTSSIWPSRGLEFLLRHDRAHHWARHQRSHQAEADLPPRRLRHRRPDSRTWRDGLPLPHMDSITSLVSDQPESHSFWRGSRAGGSSTTSACRSPSPYYLVVFAGFSAPTELAPARDRLIGILLALVIMAFVFDQLWPVRTVTAMRTALARSFVASAQLAPAPDRAKPSRTSPSGRQPPRSVGQDRRQHPHNERHHRVRIRRRPPPARPHRRNDPPRRACLGRLLLEPICRSS